MLGRPNASWGMPPFSLPVKELGLPGGNRLLSAPMSTVASSPLCAPVCAVVPSQYDELTAWKSPAGVSLDAALLGSTPGAISTRQV